MKKNVYSPYNKSTQDQQLGQNNQTNMATAQLAKENLNTKLMEASSREEIKTKLTWENKNKKKYKQNQSKHTLTCKKLTHFTMLDIHKEKKASIGK